MPWGAVPPALVASFSPTTLVIIAGLLARGRTLRLAFSFLAAAAVVTLAVGCAVVGALAASGWENKRRHPAAPPALDLALGAAALLFAVMVARRAPREVKVRSGETRLATAVILGVAIGAPSPLYLLSLHTVAGANVSSTARYLIVVLLAVIVLLMAEIPILTYIAAPERTAALLAAANSWLSRHGQSILVLGSAAVGCYFVVKGLGKLA